MTERHGSALPAILRKLQVPSEETTLMTIRVSRDGGRTWTPRQAIKSKNAGQPYTNAWPPCECPRCTPRTINRRNRDR